VVASIFSDSISCAGSQDGQLYARFSKQAKLPDSYAEAYAWYTFVELRKFSIDQWEAYWRSWQEAAKCN
jgi:hypothetical protein